MRWAGSKRSAIGALKAASLLKFDRYIEPFCGSAALYFALVPKNAILADINEELIDFYATASVNPGEVYDILSSIPRTSSEYYRVREGFHRLRNPVKRAAHFLFLNRNCFNGLYRTNMRGRFNVPFSDQRVGPYPDRADFIRACEQLSKAHFVCADFEEVVKTRVRARDLVFLDPPYASAKRLPFREYHPNSFSIEDVERLKGLLQIIDDVGASFVLTYQAGSIANLLSESWEKSVHKLRRNMSGKPASRGHAMELIITNVRTLK